MPQALTSRLTVVSQRIHTLLESKVGDTGFFTPAITYVAYGDQEQIPSVPAVCVEPMKKERSWPPTATYQTHNTLEVGIFVYYTNLSGDGVENVRLTVDQLAEAIEEFLNISHRTLQNSGGSDLVIHSQVVLSESGHVYRKGTTYRAARLLWRGTTKTSLLTAG